MEKIRNIIVAIISFLLGSYRFVPYFLSGFVPRSKKIMIFGAWEGKRFCDNTKYLFLYIRKNHPEIRAIWLTRNELIVKELREKGLEAYFANSCQGFWLSCRAKYIFITHGLTEDVNPYATRKAAVIDLFHATFPIKKMGYDHFKEYSIAKKIHSFLAMPLEFRKSEYTISPSENVSSILSSALRIKKENIKITGLPRTDLMLSKNETGESEAFAEEFRDKPFKHLIYYIPTFRSRAEFNLFDYEYDRKKLLTLLENTDSLLLLRFHPFDARKYQKIVEEGRRVVIDRSDDLYPMLKKADVLITDYSSVGFDFILLDRPIIFANFDYDEYVKERSLYMDYYQITPGSKVRNWPELIIALENAICGREEIKYRAERKTMREYIYKHIDTNASKRIMEFVKDL